MYLLICMKMPKVKLKRETDNQVDKNTRLLQLLTPKTRGGGGKRFIQTLPSRKANCSRDFRKDLSDEPGLSFWNRSQCRNRLGSNIYVGLLTLPGQNPSCATMSGLDVGTSLLHGRQRRRTWLTSNLPGKKYLNKQNK